MINRVEELAEKIDRWIDFLSGSWVDFFITKYNWKILAHFESKWPFMLGLIRFWLMIVFGLIIFLLLGVLFVLCGIISFRENIQKIRFFHGISKRKNI